eukprot:TRINITY_DN37763_c0_g1_i1.p1 TRINITY_DN37763_c0_g1~~TRINITY_DN37763_c0_g1_i1.p1  ORF type:complete len:160 (-),score=26.29 TRINITY_DN37763_c0_g1_i1:53-532(-)
MLSFFGHVDSIFSCTFSPSAEGLISCSHDNSLRIWDTESGTCKKSVGRMAIERMLGAVPGTQAEGMHPARPQSPAGVSPRSPSSGRKVDYQPQVVGGISASRIEQFERRTASPSSSPQSRDQASPSGNASNFANSTPPADLSASPVSYTHLTLPTKRIV